jgi:outer membrane murein-binding lipoprotein Lpp
MTGVEALMVVGSVVSAVGQLQASANAQRAANFNAQVGYQNAHAARLAAIEDSKRQKRLAAKRAGTNRAQDPDKLDLLEDTALEEELAFLSIIHAGEVRATGSENTARLDIARGKSAMPTAMLGAAGSVLMGGATALEGSSLFTSSSAPPIIPPRRY